MTLSRSLCAGLAMLSAIPALALDMRPGLWEFSSDNIQVDGRAMPGMAEMLEQMQALPPEQRKMMQDMLAAQGVQPSAAGLRMCLSEAQVKSRALPFQHEPGCTQAVDEQTDRLWRFRFECPDARGHGETRLLSSQEVVSVMETQYQVGTRDGSGKMQTHGKWLSADCGSLKPRD